MKFITGRTHDCGQLGLPEVDSKVKLSGWANTIRDKGPLIFIDLRDRYGITQLVFDKENCPPDIFTLAQTIKTESSLTIEGHVLVKEQANDKIKTGQIEIAVTDMCVHSICPPLPFEIGSGRDINLEIRMKWRFLDLRRPDISGKLPFRHSVVQAIREYFHKHGFIDVETPILFKSTPEGARDYVVPCRRHPGKFYALPQSPQTLKQTLMSAGLDKYFQIVRCFRDEDMRGDRQPEFTQLDMEMSFVTREDIYTLIENCFVHIFDKVFNQKLTVPFKKITHNESMEKYGHDAPDMRFSCEHKLFNEHFKETDFVVVKNCLESGGDLRMMAVPTGASLSRKQLDKLTELAKENGAKGLLWYKYKDKNFTGPVAKFLSETQKKVLISQFDLKDDSLILGIADTAKVAAFSLHKVRLEIGKLLGLIDPDVFEFCWVVDFPLFEETDNGNLTYNHHPFCFPDPEQRSLLDSDPLKVKAWSYDLVLNGWELGSGSIRNHELELQKKILSMIGLTAEQQSEQFDYLFKAIEYGAPPHGGIALGIDRIVTLLGKELDIREYIAFPKTHSGSDLFSQSPSELTAGQLEELNIEFKSNHKNS